MTDTTQPAAARPQSLRFVQLQPGDTAPWFHARTTTTQRFSFDTAGGRYILLGFYGSAAHPSGAAALRAIAANRAMFDDSHLAFFGVSLDPRDETEQRVREVVPGIRFFLDFDGAVSRLYGAVPTGSPDGQMPIRPFWCLLDPTMRVRAVIPMAPEGAEHARLFETLRALAPVGQVGGVALQAPIIVLPDVFEPELCRRLIARYEEEGGQLSGFMREVDGKTVGVHDASHKVRRDHIIEDTDLIGQIQARFQRRIIPEIQKVHQFRVTRMERYIVSCYDADDGGHFRAHRDNTTSGTAHRRFAVSVNLNDDFDGGEVGFPEYGPRSFKAPAGGAVVFSCSLLHAVSRVTRGRRYAFLPFLYDDAAAQIRQQNLAKLGDIGSAQPAER